MALYAIESGVILAGALMLTNPGIASAPLAAVFMILISVTCNSTHSILGTAAAMDLGGRKMAGFASGVIDSFQYFGASFASLGLGKLIDYAVANWRIGWGAWFYFMLPFSLAGMLLMTYTWWRTRGRAITAA
jgi:OPA family glycerol-3-phosphate transporter-like MFS transporter